MGGKFITAFVCFWTLRLVIVTAATPAQQSGNSTAILLQGFHWNSANYSNPNWYHVLLNNVDDLVEIGITHIWFPPPSDSTGGAGYLPRQLNILSSSYGDPEELNDVVHAFTEKGIKAIVDIVVNHRVGTTNSDGADFTNPEWSVYSIVKEDECNCGLGNVDTGDSWIGGRDLDHTNIDEVQNGIIKWMNEVLKPVGFTGIRFDFVRGYGANYAGKYATAFDSEFCVGEVWYDFDLNNIDANRQTIVDWIEDANHSCGAFDLTTKGILNDVLANGNYWRLKASDGKPQGAIGWQPGMTVTFVDNHDTGPAEICGSGQNGWPVPCDKVIEGYAYILTHPGVPTVFYPHIYDWILKKPIADLIKVRKGAGVTSTSVVKIQAAEKGLYAAIVTGNSKKLAIKIGPNDWSPDFSWTLETWGPNYAVWTK